MTDLTPHVTSSQMVLVAERDSTGMFWRNTGTGLGGGRTACGHGYLADAQNFPEGTRLTVTARIEMPGTAG